MPVDTDIIYPALRLAGIVTAAGRTPAPSQVADSFASLNRMLDAWRLQRLLVYTMRIDRYHLIPSQITYTIGPGGNFNGPRPIEINDAAIVLLGSSEVHTPLRILSDHEWAAKRLRVVPTTIPTEMYCDNAYPLATIYLWGYPTAGNDLELFTWQQFEQFATVDDPVSLAPGYEDAIVYNLAVRMAGQFGTQLRPDVAQMAREYKANVKANNAPSPRIASADIGMDGKRRGGFNYLTGMP